MNNRMMKINIGTINISDMELVTDCIEVSIPITGVSEKLKATIEENIQKAKKEFAEEYLKDKNLHWSDAGINVITQNLLITIRNKKFGCDLSYTFEDVENPVIWHGFNLEIDLSEHTEELKKLIIKAMIDKFF